MPRGKPGSGDSHQPRRFIVRQPNAGGRWGVKQGSRWRFASDLTIQVTTATVDVAGEGPCLSGVGVVRCLQRGAIVITA